MALIGIELELRIADAKPILHKRALPTVPRRLPDKIKEPKLYVMQVYYITGTFHPTIVRIVKCHQMAVFVCITMEEPSDTQYLLRKECSEEPEQRPLKVSKRILGISVAILGCFIASGSDTLVKIIINDVGVPEILIARNAVLILVALISFNIKKDSLEGIEIRTHIILFVLSIFRGTAPFIRYYALGYISLMDSTIMMFTRLIFVALISCLFLRERLDCFDISNTILNIVGIVLVCHPSVLFGPDHTSNESKRLLGLMLSFSKFVIINEWKIGVFFATIVTLVPIYLSLEVFAMQTLYSYEYSLAVTSELATAFVLQPRQYKSDFKRQTRYVTYNYVMITNGICSNFKKHGSVHLWAVQDTKNPKRKSIHQVSTLELSKRLIEQCHVRSDGWGEAVFTRLSCSNDLVADEGIYHKECLQRFMSNKDSPDQLAGEVGRPIDEEMHQWFQMLCIWLDVEAGAEFYTLQELHTKMSEIAHGEDVYSVKRLKQKLLKRYQDYIYFAEIGGRSNVVCFRRMVDYILNETWYEERNQNKEREAEKIILTAAKLIMAEIREIKYDSSVYPKDEEIHNQNEQWRLPNGLKTFLGVLVKSVLKQQSIGQSIVFAARPRSVIPPIMFGLGVHLDHVFGSKWLIEELSHLGFSVSYQEVTRFKQSAMATEEASQISTKFPPGTFTQYVADNVDHNLCTLDGKDTFHGMGIIISSTNKSRLQRQSQTIKREFLKPVSQVTKDKGIPLVQYIDSNFCVMSKKIFTDLRQLQFNHEFTIESNIYLLWQTSYFFKQQNRPSWSGFMQTFRSGDYPGQSEINLLPIINLNPSDMTCSYSTLLFVIDQCKKNNSGPACITFDEPLWIKATEIASKKSLDILCRLGGFHMLMSFLGSVGTVMKGSGLSECLQTIYGENSVTHIMSGKAVSRALRSHFLLQSALCLNILNNVVLQENRATTQAVQSVE
ncbi:Solute carrier family 35 member G1 [Nymphon striatum]|nr:Solute carrier family 35 member G1 [Nymphon striatum]